MNHKVKIIKLSHALDIDLPRYATEQSAGMDLTAAVDNNIVLNSGEFKIIPTGIALAPPPGFETQIRPRSGLAAKHGVTVLNSPGTVDSDYRGEIKVILINHGPDQFVIERGMRIAQIVITKHEQIIWEEVDNLDETTRGEKGFGSTGK